MVFNTNTFRRAAAGAGLVLSVLALPVAAQAATAQTSTTPVMVGVYPTSDACARAAATYTAAGKTASCRPSSIYARPPYWMLYVS
ncbi:hypothetical protein ACFFV7_46780 [Nonomuraea spiralis]|uniref:Uncharacterized protein n=1 Tax=Nonomuraea spiralis TaxID=46182 RepID=A0ABV5IXK8_9ACTN|nr:MULTISPECIES: hypothetical protein [Nonomuraea]RSN11718.1 hypothetical protein DMB42_14215 [Nonomuraea sp. WAC 01424]GGS84832.1 hypothetical protein GCM10010176_030690 [Nonomuraea spiralis]